MGGEKIEEQEKTMREKGSPPRGRGKVTRLYALADMEGITPAWAGKSLYIDSKYFSNRDHPRVGGEKFPFIFLFATDIGSPPRGRGKVQLLRFQPG